MLYLNIKKVIKNEKEDKLFLDLFYLGIPSGECELKTDSNKCKDVKWFTREELNKFDIFNNNGIYFR